MYLYCGNCCYGFFSGNMHTFVQISFDGNQPVDTTRESDVRRNPVSYINSLGETQTFQCFIDIIYTTVNKSTRFIRNNTNKKAAEQLRKLFIDIKVERTNIT